MQKKKFRINILDVLIISMVILCILGAALRVYIKNRDDKLESQTATVSFFIHNVQSASQFAFNDGDRVYSEQIECELGVLTGDVEVSNAVYYRENNGEFHEFESTGGRVDIRGTMTCKGTWTDASGFSVNGTQYLAPNMYVYVSLPEIKTAMLITDIEVH